MANTDPQMSSNLLTNDTPIFLNKSPDSNHIFLRDHSWGFKDKPFDIQTFMDNFQCEPCIKLFQGGRCDAKSCLLPRVSDYDRVKHSARVQSTEHA